MPISEKSSLSEETGTKDIIIIGHLCDDKGGGDLIRKQIPHDPEIGK